MVVSLDCNQGVYHSLSTISKLEKGILRYQSTLQLVFLVKQIQEGCLHLH